MSKAVFMRSSSFIALLSISVIAAAGTARAQARDSATPETVADTPKGEVAPGDIVVTATRRAETIQRVPLSIDAYGAAVIANAEIDRPKDFVQLTAGVNVVESISIGEANVNIRGVQAPFDTEQPYALVVDGVQSNNPNALNQELDDVEQIEFVKGPQSAIYGRNAVGGAIVINTKVPTDKTEGDILVSYGNATYHKESASLSGRIVAGALNRRISAVHVSDNGYFHNDYTGGNVDPYEEE